MAARVPRVHRSELCVPGSNPRMMEKALGAAADYVMLDLEDAVAPDDKVEARANVIAALGQDSPASTSVRINGLDTHWCHRDVIEVVERAGERLDNVVIPKVSCAADVHFVATLLTQVEDAAGLERRIGITALIETAEGIHRLDEISASCPERLEAMVFGSGDYAASIQSHTEKIGGSEVDYSVLTDPGEDGARERHWGDQWHYPLSRIAVACRANGLRPIDGPYGNFKDPDGFLNAARRAAVLGFEGKWVIHPSQVVLAHEVFTPGEELVTRARRIVAAMRDASASGSGAVSLDGRLIDAASVRQAEQLLAKVQLIEARQGAPLVGAA